MKNSRPATGPVALLIGTRKGAFILRLFRSPDGGETWEGMPGFNENPQRTAWVGTEQDAPPDGATLHSILIDPRDPRHMYVGASTGGFFESSDHGASWTPLNKGCAADFIPKPDPEYGHDPHCAGLHPLAPDRLYQQNHCDIYRMDRGEGCWIRIGRNMPKNIGDIGFPVVLHPRDPETIWVFPMDGTEVWPRTSPGGKPAVYVSRNAGKSWSAGGGASVNGTWIVERGSWDPLLGPRSTIHDPRSSKRSLVMRVYVPTPLRSYTGQKGLVEAGGSTLAELLADLDGRYPGFRFRIINEQDAIREHIKIFVNQEQAASLRVALRSGDEVQIICALSGG